MAAQDALQVLVDDEAAPDQPAVTEHHREEPDDALDPWLVGELDVELGEVDLRLLAGRRLEAHFESGGADGAKVARAIAHDAVAAGEAALLDLSPQAYGGQAGIGRQTLAQIGLEGIDDRRRGRALLVGRRLQALSDVGSDCLSIDAKLPRDRGDREALAVQI